MQLPDVPLGSFDLSDPDFWLEPRQYREGAFKTLRDTPALQFFPERELEGSPFPVGPGYYALTRHEDVWAASRNAHLFCSGKGSNIGDLPQEMRNRPKQIARYDDGIRRADAAVRQLHAYLTGKGLMNNAVFLSSLNNGTTNNFAGTLESTFSCMAALGSAGCGYEHQLQATRVALYESITPENKGFLRQDVFRQPRHFRVHLIGRQ